MTMHKDSATILIVDDLEAKRSLFKDFVESMGHVGITADNGVDALVTLSQKTVDLVLLDIMMPVMDGYQVLECIRADTDLRQIPVIVISGVDEMQSVVRCIELGADDYLIKPFNPVLLQARISACFDRKRLHDAEEEYKHFIEDYNFSLEERVREQVKLLSQTQLATIFAMSKLTESRDPETGEHLERMREYARVIATRLSLLPQYVPIIDKAFVDDIYAAAPLHDIGKVGIPDSILRKPGPLTPEEFNIMKFHTTIGADTLRAVDANHPGNAFIRIGIAIAQSHHERWDGSGYPQGLAGDAIPLAARILSLADVYDALVSKRCYKEAYSHEKSWDIIIAGSGRQFDPQVIEAFKTEIDTFLRIREQFQDPEDDSTTDAFSAFYAERHAAG